MVRPAITPLLAVAALALAACGPTTETGSSSPEYNVILISVDAFRADHVGAYGYNRPTTPFLDTLTADSVVFERAYAPSSFSRQSVSALLTGRLPTSGGSVSLDAQPHETAETLARLFRGAGLRTGMFSNSPLIGENGRGFTRGFEGIQVATLDNAQTAAEVSANALQFIDDFSPDHFMVYAHYFEPLPPFTPGAEAAATFGVDNSNVSSAALIGEIDDGQTVTTEDPRLTQLIARYDAEIAAVDNAIRSLVDGLAARGLADNTVVIVTGSQGTELLDHGYFGDAWTLYEEALRVPLILHAPGLLSAQRVAESVSVVDIYPTLVDLFNLDLDVDAWQPDGSSFVNGNNIRTSGEPIIAELVIRERCVVRAVILDNWKYIADYIPCPAEERREINSGYVDKVQAIMAGEMEAPSIWGDIQQEALFDLASDPLETRNLLDAEEEQLAYLRQRLSDYQTYSENYALKAIEAIVSPDVRRQLCGFGYGSC